MIIFILRKIEKTLDADTLEKLLKNEKSFETIINESFKKTGE